VFCTPPLKQSAADWSDLFLGLWFFGFVSERLFSLARFLESRKCFSLSGSSANEKRFFWKPELWSFFSLERFFRLMVLSIADRGGFTGVVVRHPRGKL
jgi:hypothetical protein